MTAPVQPESNHPQPKPGSLRTALRYAFLLGTLLFLIVAGVLVFFAAKSGRPIFAPQDNPAGKSFSVKLREYDRAVTAEPESAWLSAEFTAGLIRRLDDLEKDALGVESHLSVLKRRRVLAIHANAGADTATAASAYLAAACRAAERFPYSQLLSAVAAEAAAHSVLSEVPVLRNAPAPVVPPLRGPAAETAIRYAADLTEPGLIPLALSVYVLAGEISDPERAVTIPRSGEFLASVSEFSGERAAGTRFRDWENFLLDAAVIRLLQGDTRGTAVLIQPLINSRADPETAGPAALRALRFGAEFFYDFGDPRRAAEIFSRFSDDRSIGRQADALWLAGQQGPARNLWMVLISPAADGPDRITPSPDLTVPDLLVSDLQVRCLYNLASTEQRFVAERMAQIAAERAASGTPETPEEAFARRTAVTTPEQDADARALVWIERLLSLDRTHLYGLIRYTRFLDSQRALAILETTELAETEPLISLERLRRRMPDWTVDRIIPETWLLLNHSPGAAALYQWAGYYFDYQKHYGDTARLLRAAKNHGIDGPWLTFHQSINLIHDGKYDEGEALLLSLEADSGRSSVQDPVWQIPANIARLMEARRANAAALDYYAIAAAQVKDAACAAKIQYRMARCLRALGRDRESRRILEYGLTLDAENLNIRLELRRLDDMGIF
ncbi:hypothetical protein AGMMS50267_15000 [Spirochaetia bacterium]|nr:hypothetical protein AGMMS50267_15000 [Spirochaetia bacterium]